MIRENFQRVVDEIGSVCRRLGRATQDITLIGVTKYAEVPAINEALNAGLAHIAENRVQEAQRKFSDLTSPDVTRHLIGHLQTNKCKSAVELFDMIQSVDRLKVVQEIDKQAARQSKVMDVLIQVNVAGEDQKFGCHPDETRQLLDEAQALKYLNVCGLMTIAPFTENEDIIRNTFRGLKQVFDDVNQSGEHTLTYLSMGMSNDFPIALEEGANMLRIGSAIFHES